MFKSALTVLSGLSSLKLGFAGMCALLAGVLVSYLDQQQSVLWIAIPLGILVINLLSAMVFNPRIRQNSGLLMFHICLLLLALLVMMTRLVGMKGHVEIVQGQTFDGKLVTVMQQGPLHDNSGLQNISFQQGDFQVEFFPGLRRGKTTSRLLQRNRDVIVGDTTGLKQAGYYLYTTSNKGYAAMLTWHGENGRQIHGAIHFPSYPLYDWKQKNEWITPTGQSIELKFQSAQQADPDNYWILDSRIAGGTLEIETAGAVRRVLLPGEHIRLGDGRLEFTGVRMWMGYSIFYNPWLAWFFAAAIVGVSGLAWHYYLKLGRPGHDMVKQCHPVKSTASNTGNRLA